MTLLALPGEDFVALGGVAGFVPGIDGFFVALILLAHLREAAFAFGFVHHI